MRPKTYALDNLVQSALRQFWTYGYNATSVDDLVRVTGVSRHGIYSEFGGKRGLFIACLAGYRASVVDPAFCLVEQPGARLAEVAQYFEYQIARAEQAGLPGPGCLFANTATELASHDEDIMRLVLEHQKRLQSGFAAALATPAPMAKAARGKRHAQVHAYATALLAFTNGLWALSRTVDSATPLRTAVQAFLQLIAEGMNHAKPNQSA
jgi:TetR/AcrR family transcriptional regulator, transcriptional repressor for nem operon